MLRNKKGKNCAPENQKLIYAGTNKAQLPSVDNHRLLTILHQFMKLYCCQRLKDDKVLSEYSVQSGSTIHAL